MDRNTYEANEDPSSDSGNGDYTTASQSVENEGTEHSEITIDDSNLPAEDKEAIIQCVHDLKDKNKREKALAELSKKREYLQDLAPVIWHSVGTISALLQEIISIYPLLTPSLMTANVSNRACNVLALLQCVAAHTETRSSFLKANIQLFLYPFLNTVSKSRAYEYLRLTSLGVIGALVKVDDPEVINNLLHTEIIPLSLRIMERGTELSQTVATFIIQKILSDNNGLSYVCQTKQRFFTVINVMETMVKAQDTTPSTRLLKHIARCYQKLFENQKAKEFLAEQIPSILNEKSLEAHFDENTKSIIFSMRELVTNWISENGTSQMRMMHQRTQPPPMAGMMRNSASPFNMGPMPMSHEKIPQYAQPAMHKMSSQRTFMPSAATYGTNIFSRPGSSQSHITPLESQTLMQGAMPPQSPPIQHSAMPQPKMYNAPYMQYSMPQHSMGGKGMNQSQSSYQMYPTMIHEHSAGMNMYMQPAMPNHGYMMPPSMQMPRSSPGPNQN